LPLYPQWPRLNSIKLLQRNNRSPLWHPRNRSRGSAVHGVAALVTSATGDEGASQRVSPYQPSEYPARSGLVRRPGTSQTFRVRDNRSHSLRNSPAQLLRGRLPR